MGRLLIICTKRGGLAFGNRYTDSGISAYWVYIAWARLDSFLPRQRSQSAWTRTLRAESAEFVIYGNSRGF
jgi:hypothetical protein